MNTRHTALSLVAVLLVAALAPAAAATAPVGDLTVTTAPATASASAAAEAATPSDSTDSLVAESDVAVFRFNASGVPAAADDDGTLLGDELTLDLRQTASSVDTNATAKTLDATTDRDGVAVRATEDAVYVAVDLATAAFQQGNGTATAAVGDSFTVTATATDAVTDGENYTRTATFGVVEPSVNFVSGVDAATAGETVEFTAATLLAPGTSLTVSLAPGDGGESRTTQTTVGEDGRATGELSFDGFDAGQEYTISVTAEGTDLNTTVTGTTQAAATDTPAPTDTATTTESTETSTSGPGFGVVAALLSLLGAGAAVGRRE